MTTITGRQAPSALSHLRIAVVQPEPPPPPPSPFSSFSPEHRWSPACATRDGQPQGCEAGQRTGPTALKTSVEDPDPVKSGTFPESGSGIMCSGPGTSKNETAGKLNLIYLKSEDSGL